MTDATDSATLPLCVDEVTFRRLCRSAVSGFPHEVCGLLFGVQDGARHVVEIAEELPNQREKGAQKAYVINAESLLKREKYWRDRGKRLLGFWHSHPGGNPFPSAQDASFAWSGYSYVIVAASDKSETSVRSWRYLNERFVEESIVCTNEQAAGVNGPTHGGED